MTIFASPNKVLRNLMSSAINSIACLSLILLTSSCGDLPEGMCVPNVRQNGLELKVSFVRGSTFKYFFEVCQAPSTLRTTDFSVYAASTENAIGFLNLNTAVRLGHVTEGLQTGDTFEVDFQTSSGDTWFVFYQDNGSSFDDTQELIRGNLTLIE